MAGDAQAVPNDGFEDFQPVARHLSTY